MNLSWSFPLFLTLAMLITGAISLVDLLYLRKKRRQQGVEQSKWVEYARSFFPVLLLVWVIRSFVVQPYRVPSGSLLPTVRAGDFIAANQFAYGLRLPVLRYKFFNWGEPKKGDIALFHWPVDRSVIFVKRVIGTPGDHIVYKNKTLYINGQKMEQQPAGEGYDPHRHESTVKKLENLDGIQHSIYIDPAQPAKSPMDVTVPEGHYFMMGDNRDDSDDSRMWGFVADRDLVGKAFIVWFSWDSSSYSVRWDRIGKWLSYGK